MKKYGAIGLAFLASLVIWLISNLSENATGISSVPVVVHSTVVGHSDVSMESVSVSAAVSGSGFALLRLSMRGHRPVDLSVDPADITLDDGEFFHISANALYKYAESIFGKNVKVTSFVSDRFVVRFQEESYVRVPVVPVFSMKYRDQYMARDLKLVPDSVDVYGDPSRVAAVDKVMTSLISSRKPVDRDQHGHVALEVPAGMRLSTETVSYSVEVVRYVEISGKVAVSVRNVPDGKTLSVFPSTVDLTCRYIFPFSNNAGEISEVYVDYADFASSRGGRCVVKADGIPSSLIDWKVSPEVCECFETDVK